MDPAALIESAESVGVRLEMVDGTPYWEMMPGQRHHNALMSIRDETIRASKPNGCFVYKGLLIEFADGSWKTPDLSVFCKKPAELEGPVKSVPEAVVEVISRGYEKKDLEIGPPFYLAQGVLDILVVDPKTNEVTHFRKSSRELLRAPVDVRLECGCVLRIPAARE